MADHDGDTAALRAAIKFWLDISKFFYRSFRLKRYLGPQWFLVNILALRPTDSISVGDLLASMPPQTQKAGSNSQVALSACLSDLRSADYLSLTLRGNRTEPKNASFLVETTITRLPKLREHAAKYVTLMLERACGTGYARQSVDDAIETLRSFFNFSSTFLVRDWENLFQDLASASAPRDVTRYGEICNEMRGSLEYYIVLLSLWKARLLKDDEEGYETEEIWAFHLTTRHVSMKRLKERVAFLAANAILEQVTAEEEEPRFRLSEMSLAPLEAFGQKLLRRREELLLAIRNNRELLSDAGSIAPS